MSWHPIGFMSYVRSDDQYERLSKFSERLSAEVRLQTGEKFQIFQDRNDIAWGQQWQERINESLDAATFLIPILTPGFFRSEQCRNELERFLDREKDLERGDLVLPVYYVKCSILDDETKRQSDKLAQVIVTRQYEDWRDLRHEAFTSPQVSRRIAKLASQIVKALERSLPQRTPAPTSAASKKKRLGKRRTKIATPRRASPSTDPGQVSQSASALSSERMESVSGQPAGRVRGPAPKTEPPTRVVDALHRGDHATLTSAIAAARPGDRILVRPGLYREGVVIDKPVEILGDGELGDVVIESTGKDTVLFKASMGRLANVALRQAGGGKWFCVDIAQGRLDLEGCDITSQSLACVAIHGGADPRLRRNRIHDGKEGGVMVYENGQGTLEDNEIYASTFGGVSIGEGGNPTLRRNRIHHAKNSGVFVYENGQGTLEDNDIFANTLAGVEVTGGGNPTLRRNRIYNGKQGGVYVYESGEGTVEDNEIFANELAGVIITTGGKPIVRHNRIHDGKSSGVFVYENGLGTFEDNDIFANSLNGVEVTEGGNPTLRRNRISKNAYSAIYVHAAGQGVFEDNDLRENAKGAWSISKDCKLKVKRKGNQE